jgi:cytochrome c
MRNRTMTRWVVGVAAITIVGAALAAAANTALEKRDLAKRVSAMTQGDPVRGLDLTRTRGCGGCHVIPGINNARGQVGPPLNAFANRVYVGGVMSNTPDHLREWLLDPPSIDDKTAMPNVGLTDQEARDVSAFLYTLD